MAKSRKNSAVAAGPIPPRTPRILEGTFTEEFIMSRPYSEVKTYSLCHKLYPSLNKYVISPIYIPVKVTGSHWHVSTNI